MKKTNQSGFSGVEGLLIIVIVAIVGFAGWWVYKSKNDINKTQQNTAQAAGDAQKAAPKMVATKPAATDPTADWTPYSNKGGKFSLKYPKTWVTAALPDACTPGLLLIGPSSASVGHCGSDNFGEMSVSSVSGDDRSNDPLANGFTNVTKESVTVDGTQGTKVSGTAKGQPNAIGSLPDGTKEVGYIFYTNNRTYNATYIQGSSYPDVLSDFNLMITKTLKFQ